MILVYNKFIFIIRFQLFLSNVLRIYMIFIKTYLIDLNYFL